MTLLNWKLRYVLVLSAVVLVLGSPLIVFTHAQAALPPEVRDVVVRVGDRLEVRAEDPSVVSYVLTGSNVSQVQAATQGNWRVFTFTGTDFYNLNLILNAKGLREPVDVAIVKVDAEGEDTLGSYKIAGDVDFNVVLRITVLEPPPPPGESILPFMNILSSDVTSSLRVVALVVPLSYLGGFAALEAFDRFREWRMRKTVGPSMGGISRNTVKYLAIIGFILTWILVVLFL